MVLHNCVPAFSYDSSSPSTRMGVARRRRSGLAGRHALYLESLEPRQLLSGSPPTVTSFSIFVAHNQQFVFTPALFANAPDYTDPENDALDSVTIESLPISGTLTLTVNSVTTNINAGDTIPASELADIAYVPNTDFTGTDSFTWNAFDGTSLAVFPAAVNITVAIPPTVGEFPVIVPQNGSANISSVLFTETGDYTDPQNLPLTSITIVTLPTNGILSLTVDSVTTNINAGDTIPASELDGITYTPNADYTGPDGFTWNASDGELESTTPANVLIDVEAPTVTDVTKATTENQVINFTASDFTAVFVAAGDLQSIQITSLPTHGVLTLAPNTQITLNDVIPADQLDNLIYTPTAGYVGADSFGWTGSDGVSFASPGANVNITVSAPSAADISETLNQNSTLAFQEASFTIALTSSTALQSIKVISLPMHGKLTLMVNAVATPVTLNEVIPVLQIGNLVYTPATGFSGNDTFRWYASDGNGQLPAAAGINLIVAPPLVATFTESTGQNAALNFPSTDFTGNFSGGSALQSVKILTLPAHGVLSLSGTPITLNQIIGPADFGNITYTPAANYLGSDTFRWTGSDGTAFAKTAAAANLSVTGLVLLGNNTPIANGDKKPTPADFTDFANASTSGPVVTRTYVLQNNSNVTINLTGGLHLVQLTGSANFVVTTEPAASLAPGATTSFTITFTPTTAGLKKATITIPNDLVGGSPIVVGIQGTGIVTINNFLDNGTANGLEVASTKAGKGKVAAANGDILHITYTGYQLDGTVFDASSLHGNVPFVFRLDDDFADGQPYLVNSTASMSNSFVAGLAHGVIEGWDLGLQGIKVGEHRTLIIPATLAYGTNATVSNLANQTLIFDVVCNAIDGDAATSSPAWGITYQDQFGNTGALVPGETIPSANDGTDFGTVVAGESFIGHSFIGTDNSPTNANGTPRGTINPNSFGFQITGADAKDFIASGTFQQFNLFFKPSAVGVRTAVIHFFTNDPLQPDYSFAVRGVSVAPFSDLIIQTFGANAFPVSTDGSGNVLTTIPVIVENFGNAPIPSATPTTDVKITMQNTADTTSAPIVIGTIQNFNLSGLKANGSKEADIPVTIPAAFTAGTYTYTATVNSTNVIAESVTTNDTGSTSWNISGSLISTIPTNIQSDQPIVGKVVNVTVTNTGIAAVSGVSSAIAGLTLPTNEKVTINIVAINASTNVQTIITTVTESVGKLVGIDSNDTSGHSLTFKIPVNYAPGLATGSYTIAADLMLSPFLPEHVATDNHVTSSATVTVGPPAADVAATFGTKIFTTSVAADGDTNTKLPVIITNLGNEAVPQLSPTTTITIFATDTNNANTQIGVLSGADFSGIGINLTKEFDVPVIIPTSLGAADYSLTAVIGTTNATTDASIINDTASTSANITGYVIASTSSNALPAHITVGPARTKAVLPILVYNPGAMTLASNQSVTLQVIATDTSNSATPTVVLNPGSDNVVHSIGGLVTGKFKIFNVPLSFLNSTFVANTNYTIEVQITPVARIIENSIEDNLSSKGLTSGLAFTNPIMLQT